MVICISITSMPGMATNNPEIDELIEKADQYILSNPDTALRLIDEAIQLANDQKYADGIARAKKTKGLIKYYAIEFSEALDLLIESNILFEQTQNTKEQASALNLIAVIYSDQGRNKESLDIYNKILTIAEKDDIYRRAATFNNIGATYLDMGMYNFCYNYYSKAINLIQKIDEPESESQFNNNLGALFIKLNNADSAYYYIMHGLNLARNIENLHRLANSHEILAEYYRWQGKLPLALENYQIALGYAQEMGVVYEIASTAGGLSNTYADMGDFENAYTYLSLQKQMEDSVKNKEIATHITQIELEKEFQKERDLNEALSARSRLERDIFIIIIFFVSVILLILLYSFSQKKKAYRLLQSQRDTLVSQKEEIRLQAEQLSELNNIKAKLFSIISHDLRSPLSSLVAVVEATKNNTLSQKQFQEMLNDMHENIESTASLVNNLLGWARTQQDGISMATKNLHFASLARDEIALQYAALKQKSISFENTISEDIYVRADENMLRLIVRNLLSNAVKFSYAKGFVGLSAVANNGYIEITLRDEGIGIPKNKLDMLFTKGVSSTNGTHNEAGTGLGLILCREFLLLNKGDIFIESKIGEGSKFTFTLPAAIKEFAQ